jgi:hypothetical protein
VTSTATTAANRRVAKARRVLREPEFRVRLPSTIVAEVKYFNRTGDNLQ